MFSKNTNGASLFNNANTSTPTSTPTPANNTLQKPLKGNSIFGNTDSGAAVSTPSPSGSLFGSNNNATNTQTGSNNLFGTQSNGGTTGSTSGTSKTSGFSFGQNSATTGGGGLFGRSNSAGQPSTNSIGNNASNLSKGTNLFGAASTGQNSGGLFSAGNSSNATGLFGNQQSSVQPQGNRLFSSNVSSLSQSTNNVTQMNPDPYGINITNMPISVSKMPASLTAPSKDTRPHLDGPTGSTGSTASSLTSSNRRNYSVSSNSVGPLSSLPATSQSSLMNKLSSRLKSTSNVLTTQGIFSPSQDRQWASQEHGASVKKSTSDLASSTSGHNSLISSERFTPFSLQKADISDMRKLKIDPNRSTVKKLKLLSGKAVETKSHDEGQKGPESITSIEKKLVQNDDVNHVSKAETLANGNKLSSHEDEHDEVLEKQDFETDASGYWCSPSPEQLVTLSPKELAAVPNFLIGRRGYGCITFDYDVDLTSFTENLKNQLFGNAVVFNPNKTVEVYPDESHKPSIGCGLNVPATITLENVYPVDKKTKRQLKEGCNFDEVQVLVRRLKAMRSMDFVSYNPFGGVWTFKVKHFSIWGLTNEEDAEVDEQELESRRTKSSADQHFTIPRQGRQLAQSKADSHNFIPGGFEFVKSNITAADTTQNDLIDLQQANQVDMNAVLDACVDDDSLIDEKPYEPDVRESDFEGMEVEPSFSISNNWVEQLKLAGSNLRSVFADTYESTRSDDNAIELLFADFNDNVMMEKKIEKERRLVNFNFARFSSTCSLLMKAADRKIGVKNHILPSTALNNISIMDALFSKHLSVSTITERQAMNYPQVTENSLQFKDVANLCETSHPEYTLWELCSVLFDAIALPHEVNDTTVQETLLKNERHRLLCSWIVERVKDEIDGKIQATTDALDLIFLHLLKNDIPNASKIAIKSQNGHLAILIASLGSNDPRVRFLATQELERWGTGGQRVDPSISRVYQLLTGNGIEASHLVKMAGMQDISWLALLGANLYYGKIDELSLEGLISIATKTIAPVEDDYKSIIFKLYSAQNSADNILLQEIKRTTSVLDHSFLWYFAQIMRFNKLGNLSDYVCDKLTCDFIGQLRLAQLYKEGLFAACFITNDFAAKQQIDSIVYHEISYFSSGPNEVILEKLNVPSSLIFKAKALRDKYENDHLSEAQNLLKAHAFEEAEKVIVTYVGPRLIISGIKENRNDLVLLRSLLSKFPISEMQTWSKGLAVYDNYLKLKFDSTGSNEVLNPLISGLRTLFDANKGHTEILVCCNIISQEIILRVQNTHQNLDDAQKQKLLKLPLGQPERVYLKGCWT